MYFVHVYSVKSTFSLSLYPSLQTQQKLLCSLPKVLSINCQLENEADHEFWQPSPSTPSHQKQLLQQSTPRWVPMRIKISLRRNGDST